jgi:uncharacterized protein YciI
LNYPIDQMKGCDFVKKFVVILKDKKRGHLTTELLQAHVDHLRNLSQSGKLHLCGPFSDNDKAIQILIADSLEEAEAFVQQDPFVRSGYYGSYDLFELIEANESNNWLMDIPQTKENLGRLEQQGQQTT